MRCPTCEESSFPVSVGELLTKEHKGSIKVPLEKLLLKVKDSFFSASENSYAAKYIDLIEYQYILPNLLFKLHMLMRLIV